MVQVYDSGSSSTINANPQCHIQQPNENLTCEITFTVPKYMPPPVLVYYRIENFYQNHRMYYNSRDSYQLLGRVTGQDSLSAQACEPINILNNITINPCGLTANTFFYDVIKLNPGSLSLLQDELVMLEEGIAWSSDLQYMFKQPDGFRFAKCQDQNACSTCCQDEVDQEWSCKTPYFDPINGTCYAYFYPYDNTTQYLYETYPNVINPIQGVTNEHFIVWMRVATVPTFRKLYGYIDQPIGAGTTLTFTIENNWDVTSFRGSKALVLSTNNKFGGQNALLGPIFYYVGYFCLVAAVFFTIKHGWKPRRIADVRYLHYKQE
jgi:hypothetical protein